MLGLIVESIFVIISSWLLTKKYFRIASLSESIAACFLLIFAQIVLVELLWGLIGRLYLVNVFITHFLIFLAVYFVYFRKGIPVPEKPDLTPFISSNLLLFTASVFFSFFVIKSVYNLVNPPLDVDSLQYHLYFPATWIKNGNLDAPFFIFGSCPILHPGALATSAHSYYPINAELLFTWLMLPLRNAFLADLGEAPFYLIGIIAVYSILRKYSLNKTLAWLSGFTLMLIPNIFKQLRVASMNDVICAVLLLLVFETLLMLKFNFTLRNAVLFGIAVGLFVGTKFINLIWLAAFSPFICYIIYHGIKAKKLGLSAALSTWGIIAFMVILLGGYIFIKNWLLIGNPVFPVDIKFLGISVFKGLLDNTRYMLENTSGSNFNLRHILLKEGLGPQFMLIILPGTFAPFFFIRYLKNKIGAPSLKEYLLLFAAPLLMFIFYVIFVKVTVMRLTFPYLCLGFLASVIFINKLPFGEKYLAAALCISILVSLSILANRYELVTSILLSLAVFMGLVFYKKRVNAFYKSRSFAKAALAGLFLGLFLLVYLNHNYDQEEFNRYPLSFSKKEAGQTDVGKGWKALNELTDNGARVAYTGRQTAYPLFGTRLKNEVKYVSVNEKDITPYNKPDGFYRKTKDFLAWRNNLKKERIEYLFVALPYSYSRESEDANKFPVEDEWAAENPQFFKLLFKNSLVHIYSVNLSGQ